MFKKYDGNCIYLQGDKDEMEGAISRYIKNGYELINTELLGNGSVRAWLVGIEDDSEEREAMAALITKAVDKGVEANCGFLADKIISKSQDKLIAPLASAIAKNIAKELNGTISEVMKNAVAAGVAIGVRKAEDDRKKALKEAEEKKLAEARKAEEEKKQAESKARIEEESAKYIAEKDAEAKKSQGSWDDFFSSMN